MAISIPDTLTTDHSGKYVMSIRLQSDGLSFSGYIPSENNTFFYREATFDPSVPYADSLQDFFYANDFLSREYRKIYLVVNSPAYTLVPDPVFQPARQEKLLSFVHTAPGERVLHTALAEDGLCVVFGMAHETYEFCSRSFVHPVFIPSVVPLLRLWKRQSSISLSAQMFVVPASHRTDIIVYRQEKLLLANTFATEKAEDILYYILYVWKQTGLDQRHDRLSLAGDFALRQSLLQTLHVYLSHIGTVEIPSEAYLLGDSIVQAPIDIIALSLCES